VLPTRIGRRASRSIGDTILAGLAAGAGTTAALAVTHLVARAVPFPPVATAQALARAVPGPAATLAIDRLQHAAIPVFVSLVGAFFLAWGPIVGALGRRILPRLTPRTGAWIALVILWAAWSVVARPVPPEVHGTWYALATLPSVLVGAITAAVALRRSPASGPLGLPQVPRDLSRRRILASIGVGAGALLMGNASSLIAASAPGTRLRIPRLRPAVTPVPAPGDAAFQSVPGLTAPVTPLRAFYVVDEAFVDPILDPSTWRLGVGGLVASPYDLSFDDLTRMQVIERFQTLECISNPVGGQLISTARWEGVPLGALLERAGPRSGSAEVVFHSADGYSDSLPFAQAVDETTLIAIGMNGDELARRHGFPARVLSVGTYGMKNPKWLTSIEVVDRPYAGYWEERGWSNTAVAKTGCRIDVPRQGARVGSPTVVAGIAFAGDRGISKVEVSTDGGETWSPALLETALSPYTWVRWMYRWTPLIPGVVTIRARAYDGEGAPESPMWAPPHPDGASGLPVIAVQVAPSTRT